MKELLKALSIPLLIEIIFHPLVELSKEIDAISLDRHKIRSSIKIIFTIVNSILMIYFSFHNVALNDFFIKITKIFNIPQESQAFGSEILLIIASCHLGNYVTNIIIKSFCRLYFGDAEFYITPKQLTKLEKKFKEQVNYEIQDKHIIEVVDFCINNLRKQDSREIAAKKEDWKNTLECLIYDGDAEHFLDQQKALYVKKQILEHKLQTLINYSNKPHTPLTPNISMPLQPHTPHSSHTNKISNSCPQENQPDKPLTTTSPKNYGSIMNTFNNFNLPILRSNHKNKIQQKLREIKVDVSENTPLLNGQDIELNAITNNHQYASLTPPITPKPKSRKLLIEYQKNLLKQQELATTEKILPAPFAMQSINFRSNNDFGIPLSNSKELAACLQLKM